MQHVRQVWERLFDHPFIHLTRWELRQRRGRRRGARQLAFGLLTVGIAAAGWWAASQRVAADDLQLTLPILVIAALVGTPFRDHVAEIAQLTFGYGLLRWTAYLVIGFARVMLPIIVAGTGAQERRTGRLDDLRLTPIAAREIYLARAFAAAWPFLAQGVALLVLFAGVVWSEGVPPKEVARLAQEVAGQALLAAFVSVTCAALFASPWTSVGIACLWLWLLVPLGWGALLMLMNGASLEALDAPLWVPFIDVRRALDFDLQCAAQTAWTAAAGAIAFLVGVAGLRRHGMGRAGRRSDGPRRHQRRAAGEALRAGRCPQKGSVPDARGVGGAGA